MIIIGEKINGSIPSVAKAIAEKDAGYIKNLAKKQADAKASFIDVCASVAPDVELETLKWLIGLVEEATDVPLSVDSPNAKMLAAAFPFCKKTGIINSVSMEGDKLDQVFPAIAGSDWKVVALLCDDTGVPGSSEKRLAVFDSILKKATANKIAPDHLYIDPVVEMLASAEDGIAKILATIKKLKEICPDVHITSGASNISYNLPLRKFINRGFMVLCMGAGMDSAIIDPTNKEMLALVYATEALLARDDYCMEYISAFREGLFDAPAPK
jgi:5-methyltetrahydrofolate--homocysteine methyltransferase